MIETESIQFLFNNVFSIGVTVYLLYERSKFNTEITKGLLSISENLKTITENIKTIQSNIVEMKIEIKSKQDR